MANAFCREKFRFQLSQFVGLRNASRSSRKIFRFGNSIRIHRAAKDVGREKVCTDHEFTHRESSNVLTGRINIPPQNSVILAAVSQFLPNMVAEKKKS